MAARGAVWTAIDHGGKEQNKIVGIMEGRQGKEEGENRR
jgi:hypothetical protein